MSKRRPFVMIPKDVLDAAAAIDPPAQVVHLALYRIQSDAKPKDKELFRAGAGRVARYCRLSRRTIQDKMKKLEEAGLIRIKSGRRANRDSDQEENQVTLITSAGDALVPSAQLAQEMRLTSAGDAPALAQEMRSYKDTKIIDTLSTLSKPKRESQKRERVEVMIQRVAKELNTPEEQVEAHWEKHRGSMAAMNTGAFATTTTFANYMDGQPRPKPQATPEEIKGRWVRGLESAKEERALYWSKGAKGVSGPKAVSATWEDASPEERGKFMESTEGATYLPLIEARSNNGKAFKVIPDNGEIIPAGEASQAA